MNDPLPLGYATPGIDISKDDRYYVRMLGHCYSVFGVLLAFTAVTSFCYAEDRTQRIWETGTMGGMAISFLFTGFSFYKKRWKGLAYVVGVLLLPGFPIFTILGVSTIVVLLRPGVKAIYAGETVVEAIPVDELP